MKKHAFTMAEAVLVMTILGIIATIMITALKPAEFKEKGLKVLAKKVMSELDNATTQILLNNSADGTLDKLYKPDTAENETPTTFSAADENQAENMGKLYKKYLTTIRKDCSNATECGACSTYDAKFFLKDGACVGIKSSAQENAPTIFPGETETNAVSATHGVIFFDINGKDEPNAPGKDQFLMPLNSEGIQYTD